ncbi:MAG: OmpA family protein, partial [Thiotrichales bacterium]|nr:OmpA family protein [Thiotrichales bacterium]
QRVGTEEEASEPDEPAAEETAAEDETAAPAEEGDTQEEFEINWEGERVDPSGKVIAAGGEAVTEELILAPGPELVGVVYFDDESDQVGGGDRDLLEQLVALYKERGGRLRLVGHSSAGAGFEDEVAQRIADLDLSLKRANAVASTLVDLGAEKDKLKIEAKADGDPANGEVIVGGEASHRRVEIFLEH